MSLCACGATQRYVSKDKSYGADIPNAVLYDKLQDAVKEAVKGDTIWVKDGFECTTADGTSTDATYGSAVLLLTAESVTIRGETGDWRTGPVVDGGNTVRCLLCTAKSPTLIGIRFVNGKTSGSDKMAWGGCVDIPLTGGNVKECFIANGSANYGGGINGDSLTTRHCVISNCTCTVYGNGQRGGNSYDTLFIKNYGTYGAWQYAKNADTIVSNCTFVGNSGDGSGAAVSSSSSSGTHVFYDCRFFDNDGSSAGYPPVYGYGKFYNCVFSGNTGYKGGAVASFYDSKAKKMVPNTIKCYSCVFTNNCDTICLGAVGYYVEFVNCRIENNGGNDSGTLYGCSAYNTLIAGNKTKKNGAAIYAVGDSENEYVNCTIVGNEAKNGAVAYAEPGSTLTLVNTILAKNSATADDSYTSATTCFFDSDGDPKLVKAGKEFAFWPKPKSPCVGAGTVLDWMSDETDARSKDLAGLPRLTDGKVNIGCYEGIAPMPGLLLLLR